jgi:hypothetical protein
MEKTSTLLFSNLLILLPPHFDVSWALYQIRIWATAPEDSTPKSSQNFPYKNSEDSTTI